MLTYVVLGLALLAAVIGGLRLFLQVDPARLARIARPVAIALVGLLSLLLIARGQFFLSMLLLGMAYFLHRQWQLRGMGRAPANPGQSSRVETAYLEMTLDHESSRLDGVIRTGEFQGKRLAELSIDDLVKLRAACAAADPESVPLIEAYLDRIHGPGWRQRGTADTEAGTAGPGQRAGQPGAMTAVEAYRILGLEPGASPEDVRKAHRRLMERLHPDHGGSNELAARVNQAREVLLGDAA